VGVGEGTGIGGRVVSGGEGGGWVVEDMVALLVVRCGLVSALV
jgi:hypothetical protein